MSLLLYKKFNGFQKANNSDILLLRHFYCIFLFLLRFVIINTFKKKKTIEVRQSIYLCIYKLVLYFFRKPPEVLYKMSCS